VLEYPLGLQGSIIQGMRGLIPLRCPGMIHQTDKFGAKLTEIDPYWRAKDNHEYPKILVSELVT
jgi:hypothetical protein